AFERLILLERGNAGDGLNAAHAGGDGLLGDKLEDADVARALDVRAAAQFLAVEAAGRVVVGDGDHADVLLRVAVAEKGQGAGGQGLIEGQDIGGDFLVVQDLVVDLLLDFAELGGVHVAEVGEIEAQVIGGDEGAGLFDVRAQDV